jgi:hypothetical protein
MRVIETNFDGYRFRSRTEARWAVFFKTCGIAYEYEKEGYVLDGTPYLPDFWLPGLNVWLEVKGAEPSPEECDLCQKLATATERQVLLAVGAPKPEEQIIRYYPGGPFEDDYEGRFFFADDRKFKGTFWLTDGYAASSFGGPAADDRYPGVYSLTAAGYPAAKAARFETKSEAQA